MSTHAEALIDVVRSLMRQRGIGVRELAGRMGQSPGNLGDKLKARRRWLYDDLWTLAEALDVSPVDLVRAVEHQRKSPVSA
ncbi:helix-turn-helix domain-containing protein [Nocardiopsis sp. NPDC050513]|uniref:helix-turn-helix domain-containing protein n=1 Tax=Nocardiopsis sp. NPDC050513 TaxID=3364338 RepID=UPI00379A2631